MDSPLGTHLVVAELFNIEDSLSLYLLHPHPGLTTKYCLVQISYTSGKNVGGKYQYMRCMPNLPPYRDPLLYATDIRQLLMWFSADQPLPAHARAQMVISARYLPRRGQHRHSALCTCPCQSYPTDFSNKLVPSVLDLIELRQGRWSRIE